eukprot:GHVN01006551.1.p1 GENE.GHVN01006551.1~~GHVN01006551.1.p1  ORF type:complete len:154 (+),score=10.38 GHVN01006551.1:903-1364(+)
MLTNETQGVSKMLKGRVEAYVNMAMGTSLMESSAACRPEAEVRAYNARMCSFYLAGHCKKGRSCDHKHPPECSDFQKGSASGRTAGSHTSGRLRTQYPRHPITTTMQRREWVESKFDKTYLIIHDDEKEASCFGFTACELGDWGERDEVRRGD